MPKCMFIFTQANKIFSMQSLAWRRGFMFMWWFFSFHFHIGCKNTLCSYSCLYSWPCSSSIPCSLISACSCSSSSSFRQSWYFQANPQPGFLRHQVHVISVIQFANSFHNSCINSSHSYSCLIQLWVSWNWHLRAERARRNERAGRAVSTKCLYLGSTNQK